MYVVVYLLYMKIPKSVFHVTMRRKKMNLTAIISMEFAEKTFASLSCMYFGGIGIDWIKKICNIHKDNYNKS